ncbi:RNA polymerase II subunit A C-terminal domain phosphatase [Neocloeon triangulifer]|uniref:RNA polymerase II subunit A C-terminal domain phosphatase n=1 Tax=Neocloeon triangulifer TaxID=2078957 RepID=UPI00286F04C9|nr:RNA polymerase II subunit A C-terminal domain phosphatase [Neocloeon triangulifer]
MEMEMCSHPTVMRDLCAECGADLSNEQQTASVPMVHSVPDLKVSVERAQQLGKVDEKRLLKDRKLVLLVDLDQTLIHTTNDNVPPNLKDVHHFQLYGPHSPWYHTRLRPLTAKFLESMFSLFELHICTFGARLYAHTIAKMLDTDERLFSHRILSRDECFDPHSKTANLSALFPCGDHMVCIIDDREDVWNFASNVVAVKPYHFFQHTGDINAPPGLDKHEQDGSGCVPEVLVDKNTKSTEDPKLSEKSEEKTSEIKELKSSEDVKDEEKGVGEIEKEEKEKEEKEKEECKIEDEKSKGDGSETKLDRVANEEKVEKIEIDDPDDYLIYLEEILKSVHAAFYKEYDETGQVPVMRDVIPKIRSKVLEGQRIVFSGVVPTHVSVNNSRYAQMARKLGATVAEQVVAGETTHLVAARHGTAKVNEARRAGSGIQVVSPEWLVCCSERWERVDERLFPIPKSPKRVLPERHLRLSSSMAESYNPLLVLSSDDLKSMDQEVDDICNETDDESAMDRDSDTDDQDEETLGEDSLKNDFNSFVDDFKTDDEESQDDVSRSRKRSSQAGEEEEPKLKLPKDSNDSLNGTYDTDSESSEVEGDLSEMGLALEREFLSD